MISMKNDPRQTIITQNMLIDPEKVFKFWMNEDSLAVPGVLTYSELLDTIAANHTHDNDYAAINHNHDNDYAASNHNHDETYIQTAFCAWAGNATSNGNRDINFSPAISPEAIIILRDDATLDTNGALFIWVSNHALASWGIFVAYASGRVSDVFYETPSIGKLPLYRQSVNQDGWYYNAIILGKMTS